MPCWAAGRLALRGAGPLPGLAGVSPPVALATAGRRLPGSVSRARPLSAGPGAAPGLPSRLLSQTGPPGPGHAASASARADAARPGWRY